MFALLLAAALEDVAELHERWQVAKSILLDELTTYANSCREQTARITNERSELELIRQLEEYKNDLSPLLFGMR